MKLVDIFTAMCVGTMLLSVLWLIGLFTYMIYLDRKAYREKGNKISNDMNEQIKRQKELKKIYQEQKKQNDEVFNRFNKYN